MTGISYKQDTDVRHTQKAIHKSPKIRKRDFEIKQCDKVGEKTFIRLHFIFIRVTMLV